MGHVTTRARVDLASDPGDFRAVVRCRDAAIGIALQGELDVASVPVLLAAVAPLLRLEGLSVELDARELSFLDASGIGCIVRIRYVLRARGGDLAMRSVSPLARRLLVVCGLGDLLVDEPPGDGPDSEWRDSTEDTGERRQAEAWRVDTRPVDAQQVEARPVDAQQVERRLSNRRQSERRQATRQQGIGPTAGETAHRALTNRCCLS